MATRTPVMLFGPYTGEGSQADSYTAPSGGARALWVNFCNTNASAQRCRLGVTGGSGSTGPVVDQIIPANSNKSFYVNIVLLEDMAIWLNCAISVYITVSGEELNITA